MHFTKITKFQVLVFGESFLGEILIESDETRRRSNHSDGIIRELASPKPTGWQSRRGVDKVKGQSKDANHFHLLLCLEALQSDAAFVLKLVDVSAMKTHNVNQANCSVKDKMVKLTTINLKQHIAS